jgi:hypothetical protein
MAVQCRQCGAVARRPDQLFENTPLSLEMVDAEVTAQRRALDGVLESVARIEELLERTAGPEAKP